VRARTHDSQQLTLRVVFAVIIALCGITYTQATACSQLVNAPSSIGASTIVLVERGTCSFGDKAWNVQQFGAAAVVIYNNGGEVVVGACHSPAPAPVPALMLTHFPAGC